MSEKNINGKVEVEVEKKHRFQRDYRLKTSRRDRYYVCFLTKEGSIFRLSKKKKIKPTITEVRSNKGLHCIDTSKVSYRKKGKYYIFFDLLTNTQLGLICFGDEATIPADILKILIKKNVIKQLTSQLMGTSLTSTILFLIVGCVAGLGLGWILREMIV